MKMLENDNFISSPRPPRLRGDPLVKSFKIILGMGPIVQAHSVIPKRTLEGFGSPLKLTRLARRLHLPDHHEHQPRMA